VGVGIGMAFDEAGRDDTGVGTELQEAAIAVGLVVGLGLVVHRVDLRGGRRHHYCG